MSSSNLANKQTKRLHNFLLKDSKNYLVKTTHQQKEGFKKYKKQIKILLFTNKNQLQKLVFRGDETQFQNLVENHTHAQII